MKLAVVILLFATSLATTAATAAGAPATHAQRATVTARQYWNLDDRCRGESDPEVYVPACKKRDRALKSLGLHKAREFHRAWKHGKRKVIRRIVQDNLYLPYFRGRATGKRECAYDESVPRVFCWMKPRGRNWIGVAFEVTRYQRPRLPRWQVVSAAPDV